jgi:hypothetical protein
MGLVSPKEIDGETYYSTQEACDLILPMILHPCT